MDQFLGGQSPPTCTAGENRSVPPPQTPISDPNEFRTFCHIGVHYNRIQPVDLGPSASGQSPISDD
jgi:hypothetical protein